MLYDTVQSELEEKIRRLEEDRHSIDITSGEGSAVSVMFKYLRGGEGCHCDAQGTLTLCNIWSPVQTSHK